MFPVKLWFDVIAIGLVTLCIFQVTICIGMSKDFSITKSSVDIIKGTTKNISLTIPTVICLPAIVELNATYYHSENGYIPLLYPKYINFNQSSTEKVTVQGIDVGQVILYADEIINEQNTSTIAKVWVYVKHSYIIYMVVIITGWISFFAWGLSSYPQIFLNFSRKSNIGFSMDFLILNMIGYVCYCMYNIGMFWIPAIKTMYDEKYPDGVNPVQLTDVIMTMNGVFVLSILCIQALMYERSNVSLITKVFVAISIFGVTVLAVLSATSSIVDWLEFLLILSYIKLGITVIKYSPQVYLNYTRKSTVGWSIKAVELDATGGVFSLLQMLFQAYNNNEWSILFGDPTKFFLAILTLIFDLIFFIQKSYLYPDPTVPEDNENTPLLGPKTSVVNS